LKKFGSSDSSIAALEHTGGTRKKVFETTRRLDAPVASRALSRRKKTFQNTRRTRRLDAF
jgi:hypothetical protein